MITVVDVRSDKPGTRKEISATIDLRVKRTLQQFGSLPDDALIGIRPLCVLIDRSPASIWRDVAAGRLPRPTKVGHSTRWRVGNVRAVMRGAAVATTEVA